MDIIKDTLKWALPSAKLVCRLLAVNAEVLCRHSFGQRYAPQIIGSFLLVLVYAGLSRVAFSNQPPQLLGTYLLIYFGVVCSRLARMFRPRFLPVHSHSPGQSWSGWRRFRIEQRWLQLLVEPALVVVLGWIVSPMDLALSVWLAMSGLCLFVKELLFQAKQRNRLFDALDARAEGERMNTGIRRTAPESNGDQVATPVTMATPPVPGGIPANHIVRHLDPALQRLMSPDRPTPPNTAATTDQRNPLRRQHTGPRELPPRMPARRPPRA